jgi:hypothetical protein
MGGRPARPNSRHGSLTAEINAGENDAKENDASRVIQSLPGTRYPIRRANAVSKTNDGGHRRSDQGYSRDPDANSDCRMAQGMLEFLSARSSWPTVQEISKAGEYLHV